MSSGRFITPMINACIQTKQIRSCLHKLYLGTEAVGENAEIQARFAIAKAMLYRYLSLGGSFNVVEGQNKLAIDAAQFAKENALDEKTRNLAISLLDNWGEN